MLILIWIGFKNVLKATSKHSILTICFHISILCQFIQTYLFPEQNILHIKKEYFLLFPNFRGEKEEYMNLGWSKKEIFSPTSSLSFLFGVWYFAAVLSDSVHIHRSSSFRYNEILSNYLYLLYHLQHIHSVWALETFILAFHLRYSPQSYFTLPSKKKTTFKTLLLSGQFKSDSSRRHASPPFPAQARCPLALTVSQQCFVSVGYSITADLIINS